MAFWHCPHCGTPQAEASRCWVCKRSSTTCRTCRSFRAAVAGGLGYCALDRRRAPLRGDEVKGCWEAPASAATHAATHAASPATDEPTQPGAAGPAVRGWTEVATGSRPDASAAAAPGEAGRDIPAPPGSPHAPGRIDPPPIGLWGEIEP